MRYLLILVVLASTTYADVQKDIVDPYVEVYTEHGVGAGTVIELDGESVILTAYHVIKPALVPRRQLFVTPFGVQEVEKGWQPVHATKQQDGKRTSVLCDVLFYTPLEEEGGRDLALLKPRASIGSAAVLATKPPKVGRDVWYIGTPGVHAHLEKSIVSRTDYNSSDNNFLLFSGSGWYGNSGGGVFHFEKGKHRLIGVTVRLASPSNPKSPVMAEPLDVIQDFLLRFKDAKRSKADSCRCEGPTG